MAHRRMVLQERLTAIIGSLILLGLVGLSYYYSIQLSLLGLKYIPSASSPDFTATNVSLSDFDANGLPLQRLVAQRVKHYSDERMIALSAQFYTLNVDKPQVFVSADRAESMDALETIQLVGNVHATRAATATKEPLSFQTDFLNGFLDTHLFETTYPVVLQQGADITTAQNGLRYDNIAHTLRLHGPVKTTLDASHFKNSQ